MTAILGMLKIVPAWCWWLVLLVALCVGCDLHGRNTVQAKWDAFNVAQAIANKRALDDRAQQNADLARTHKAVSDNIQKAHDDEITKVRADLATAKRLRIGTALCPRPAGQTVTASSGGGNGADTGGGLVRADVGRDIDALKLKVEKAFAAGRAAQSFIRDNGLELIKEDSVGALH